MVSRIVEHNVVGRVTIIAHLKTWLRNAVLFIKL